jgi:hypothetical protein
MGLSRNKSGDSSQTALLEFQIRRERKNRNPAIPNSRISTKGESMSEFRKFKCKLWNGMTDSGYLGRNMVCHNQVLVVPVTALVEFLQEGGNLLQHITKLVSR